MSTPSSLHWLTVGILKKNRKDLESAIHDGTLLAPSGYSIKMH